MPTLVLSPETEQLVLSPTSRGTSLGRFLSLRRATHERWIVCAAFLLATTTFTWGEKLQVNGSWDGVTYTAMAKNFYRETCQLPLDSYHLQRIVPSGIVHYGLRGLGIERSDANILGGFGALNIACISF